MSPAPATGRSSSPAGLVIAALRGGSGKTIFSVGIIAALGRRGKSIAPFKKGPDYIDAGWLAMAAGRPCYNLDTFLIDPGTICASYGRHTADTDLAVIEGNRGLYDCIDTKGETSTAELAKLIGLPVILCIDGTKTTRTMAAVVNGCAQFDPDVTIGGVVLNRVAGARHERILRDSIEQHCGIPVLGAVPKLGRQGFPERHMGLVPTPEHSWAQSAIETIGDLAERYIDLDQVMAIAARSKPAKASLALMDTSPVPPAPDRSTVSGRRRPCIGVIRDSAFQFYYPENLEALTTGGAELVFTSPLSDARLPELDGLYIGGGFPETHAAQLAENTAYRQDIKMAANQGMPIYAECGGLMYLGEALVLDQTRYPMCGVLPATFGLSKRPQGHGYTRLRVARDNPYFKAGEALKGHEFHYSTVLRWDGNDDDLAFEMKRGTGFTNGRDGVCVCNVLATYTHIHSLGTPHWANALVALSRDFSRQS